MAKFEKGDKVVRLEQFIDELWLCAFDLSNLTSSTVCEVVTGGPEGVTLMDIHGHVVSSAHVTYWAADCFRLATSLEIHQGCALPAEDHIAEGKEHVDSLREKIASLEAELAKCCGTVADKPLLLEKAAELESELTAAHFTIDNLKKKLTEVEDQRDAAVIAAKSLGDEVQGLRHDRRALRLNFTQCAGYVQALAAGVEDVDLEHLYNQLHAVGEACDEQGNGADANLAYDAAVVVEMVKHTLDEYLRFLEE
jgi:hypothetical protein